MKCLVVVGSAFLIGSASAFAPRYVATGANQAAVRTPTSLQAAEIAGLSQEAIVAGGAALVGLLGIALSSGGSNGATQPAASSKKAAVVEAEVEAVDVSIPYDAAARLAFAAMNGKEGDDATFQKFNEMYITKTVAQVTAKKVARDAVLEAERFASIAAQAEKDMAALV